MDFIERKKELKKLSDFLKSARFYEQSDEIQEICLKNYACAVGSDLQWIKELHRELVKREELESEGNHLSRSNEQLLNKLDSFVEKLDDLQKVVKGLNTKTTLQGVSQDELNDQSRNNQLWTEEEDTTLALNLNANDEILRILLKRSINSIRTRKSRIAKREEEQETFFDEDEKKSIF